MYTCMYVCIYLSIYLSIYVSMYLCIYASMNLCLWLHVYIYIVQWGGGVKQFVPEKKGPLPRGIIRDSSSVPLLVWSLKLWLIEILWNPASHLSESFRISCLKLLLKPAENFLTHIYMEWVLMLVMSRVVQFHGNPWCTERRLELERNIWSLISLW